MELLVTRQQDLGLSAHMGCVYTKTQDGKFSYQCYAIGPTGPTGSFGATGLAGPTSSSGKTMTTEPAKTITTLTQPTPPSVQPTESTGSSWWFTKYWRSTKTPTTATPATSTSTVSVTPTTTTTPISKTTHPKAVQFTIGFNKDHETLYKKILAALRELETSGDEIKISPYEPRQKRDKLKEKPEHKKQIAEITKRNTALENKFNGALKQLEEMGCDTYELGGPSYENIPDEYYEWNTYMDYSICSISVCCHENTKFYKFLEKNDYIRKYCPSLMKPKTN